MIEVEIRGRLNKEEFNRLTTFLKKEGEFVSSQDREMILLRGYAGYSKDPTARDVDIRLRNTNGSCEVMLKHKSSDNNVARKEVSLALEGTDLSTAKEVFKALGYSGGIWMHRKKDIYKYKNIEWSVVDVPEDLCYYEAEQEIGEGEDSEAVKTHLETEATKLGLTILGPAEMREFIYQLDAKVNKEISW